ncbi:hypothetical protein CY35_17G027100 [Sphagnum magellanicum]|jgi:UDP-galactose transporter B1|nr:hypothetical protein CY35_17G027100 [Sphagnum magellanicum]
MEKKLYKVRGGRGPGKSVWMLCVCVPAIYVTYITQGIVQENVSTTRYGEKQERFEHLAFLNFAQNVVCFLSSLLMLHIWPNLKKETQAPIVAFWSASISHAIGTGWGITALKYISYPAQVLAKSSKMIPVMFTGAIVYGVHYTIPEYLCTFLITGGVSIFSLLKNHEKVVSKVASPNQPFGYALCFLNLGCDGFTHATQDAITKRYPKTNAVHIMMCMNMWSSIYMGIFMLGWPGGGGWAAIKFVCEHPKAAWDITLFCLCGVVGQNFIFLIISHFGSLVTNIITTTRKFFSILISSLWNGNPLSFQQWASVVMVFTGLSYHIYLKWKQKASHGHGGSKTPPYANEHEEDDGSQFVARLRSRNSSTL